MKDKHTISAYLGQAVGIAVSPSWVITIVIAAIMGVFFAQFVSTSVIHSADPVLPWTTFRHHTMEYMTAD